MPAKPYETTIRRNNALYTLYKAGFDHKWIYTEVFKMNKANFYSVVRKAKCQEKQEK